jgi:Flp pilus assembly pilin Flp
MTDAITWLVVRTQNVLANAREREEGQTFVEYALLLAGIAILLIVAIIFLKNRIANLFSDTGSSLSNPVSS